MPIDFPNSPTNGQTYTVGSRTWQYSTATGAWTQVSTNTIALGADTTGNYVATVTGTTDQVTVAGSGSESAAVTLSLPQSIATTSSPTFQNMNLNGSLIFEGSTADANETTLAVVDPTADRTINLPNANGTVLLMNDSAGKMVLASLTSTTSRAATAGTTYSAITNFGSTGSFNTVAGRNYLILVQSNIVTFAQAVTQTINLALYRGTTLIVELPPQFMATSDNQVVAFTYLWFPNAALSSQTVTLYTKSSDATAGYSIGSTGTSTQIIVLDAGPA